MSFESEKDLIRTTDLVFSLKERAEKFPDSVFFECDGEAITYGELWKKSGELGCSLLEGGLKKGEIVASLSPNSVMHLCLMFACLRAGLIWAPINFSLKRNDLADTLGRLRPKLLVVSTQWLVDNVSWGKEVIDQHDAKILSSSMNSSPQEDKEKWGLKFLEEGKGSDENGPEYHWAWNEESWIIYSGATTGRPKAVILPHCFGVASAIRTLEKIDPRPNDKFYSILQMCHGWLVFHVLVASLLGGIRCAATRWFSASRWAGQVKSLQATIVDPFLPMISAILKQPADPEDRNLPARLCIGALGTSSADTSKKLREFEERFGLQSINVYGGTEIGGLVAREENSETIRSNGRVHPAYEIRIANEEGWELPDGEAGEILIRSRWPGVLARGYYNDEARTLESWRDLWVHTADIGYVENGRLFFIGRQAHWIRRKAENVSVDEVEEAIRRLIPDHTVVVVGVPSSLGDEDVMAFIGGKRELLPTFGEIREKLKNEMAFFKIPRYWEIIEEFPKTIKGEISRLELKNRGKGPNTWDTEKP